MIDAPSFETWHEGNLRRRLRDNLLRAQDGDDVCGGVTVRVSPDGLGNDRPVCDAAENCESSRQVYEASVRGPVSGRKQ